MRDGMQSIEVGYEVGCEVGCGMRCRGIMRGIGGGGHTSTILNASPSYILCQLILPMLFFTLGFALVTKAAAAMLCLPVGHVSSTLIFCACVAGSCCKTWRADERGRREVGCELGRRMGCRMGYGQG